MLVLNGITLNLFRSESSLSLCFKGDQQLCGCKPLAHEDCGIKVDGGWVILEAMETYSASIQKNPWYSEFRYSRDSWTIEMEEFSGGARIRIVNR